MNVSRSARRAKTLDARYYHSAEIYRLESERIFGCQWLYAGRASEVSEPGHFQRLEVEGESLILLRDGAGALRCFYNVCRHRGTRLCEGSRGQLGQTIRCPYHGWTYGLTGQLLAAPNMADVADFDPAGWPLKEVAARVWEGFVFVNFTPGVPFSMDESPFSTKFSKWALPDLVSAARCEYEIRANWKLLFQNYNECYHCPRVHPRLNALSPYRTATNDLQEGPLLGGPMQLADGVDSITTTGAACAPVLPGLSEPESRRIYYYSLFPTMLLSPHPDFVLVHRVERAGPAVTRVTCEFLFDGQAAREPAFDPAPAVEFWDETNRQDWHVCELSQLGIVSRGYEPGPYSNLESTVAAFDRHYLESLSE